MKSIPIFGMLFLFQLNIVVKKIVTAVGNVISAYSYYSF